jgi:hypothetical protein
VAKYGRTGDLEPQAYLEFNTSIGVQTEPGKDQQKVLSLRNRKTKN